MLKCQPLLRRTIVQPRGFDYVNFANFDRKKITNCLFSTIYASEIIPTSFEASIQYVWLLWPLHFDLCPWIEPLFCLRSFSHYNSQITTDDGKVASNNPHGTRQLSNCLLWLQHRDASRLERGHRPERVKKPRVVEFY